MEVKMTHTRTTKNTYRYETDDEAAPVRTLYVQQTAFQGQPSAEITVTIEAGA